MIRDPLALAAAATPGRRAFHASTAGPALDYAALDALADRMAAGLVARGVRAGDRVALMAHNRVDFFALLFACARVAAMLVPLNWRLADVELTAIIADAEPVLLLADAAHLPRAETLQDRTGPIETLPDDAPVATAGWDPGRPWYLLYTSGTTGLPKGVIQTGGNALANRANACAATGLDVDDVVLAALPQFHTAGINLYALPALLTGASVIVLPAFDAAAVAEALTRATIFLGVPQVYQRLLALPAFTPPRPVRHWGSGGAALPPGLIAHALERGLVIQHGMGMTETGPTAFVMDRAAVRDRPASSGRAQPLVEARIVSEGRDRAPGEIGEILFRGPAVTPGYWRRPEETAAAFDRGWLRSGDLGRIDGDGYLTVMGRLTDMFVLGGENVHPAEVEAALLAHPAVAEAAVKGVEDQNWGEVGHAWIVPTGQPPSVEALNEWCRERLAGFKCPRGYTFMRGLPRTVAGKVRKRELLVQEPVPA